MNPIMSLPIALVLAGHGAALSHDLSTRLAALSQIESGNNDHKVGAAGELSRYQIRTAVWKQHFKGHKPQLSNPDEAARCAKVHTLWLLYKYQEANGWREASAAQFYCMWNMGYAGFRRRGYLTTNCPREVRERAERYANIYTSLLNNQ
jgi:hypothetical protein